MELQRLNSVSCIETTTLHMLPEMDSAVRDASDIGLEEARMTQVIQVELPEGERD